MKKVFFIPVFLLASQFIYSQTTVDSLSSKNILTINKLSKTIVINTSDLTERTVTELKDEFSTWKEKIVSIDLNEGSKQLKITHNHYINEQEFFDVLLKYNITKKTIVSYK